MPRVVILSTHASINTLGLPTIMLGRCQFTLFLCFPCPWKKGSWRDILAVVMSRKTCRVQTNRVADRQHLHKSPAQNMSPNCLFTSPGTRKRALRILCIECRSATPPPQNGMAPRARCIGHAASLISSSHHPKSTYFLEPLSGFCSIFLLGDRKSHARHTHGQKENRKERGDGLEVMIG